MLFAPLILLLLASQDAAPVASEPWTELRTGEPFELELIGRHPLHFDEEGEPDDWGSVGLDRAGRALVQAECSGAVHVFDAEGRELLVCRPPTAFRGDPLSFVTADARGRVVSQRGLRGPADLYDERGVWIGTGAPPGVLPVEVYRAFLASDPHAEGWWVLRRGVGTLPAPAELEEHSTLRTRVLRSADGFLHLRQGRTLQALPTCPDGTCWRAPIFTIRGDGGLVVIDGPVTSVGMDMPPPPPDPDPRVYLFVYDARGELQRSLVLPDELRRSIRASSGRVVFLGAGARYDALAVLDLRTGVVRKAPLDTRLHFRQAWGPVQQQGRVELWRLDGRARRLDRFVLPGGELR